MPKRGWKRGKTALAEEAVRCIWKATSAASKRWVVRDETNCSAAAMVAEMAEYAKMRSWCFEYF